MIDRDKHQHKTETYSIFLTIKVDIIIQAASIGDERDEKQTSHNASINTQRKVVQRKRIGKERKKVKYKAKY